MATPQAHGGHGHPAGARGVTATPQAHGASSAPTAQTGHWLRGGPRRRLTRGGGRWLPPARDAARCSKQARASPSRRGQEGDAHVHGTRVARSVPRVSPLSPRASCSALSRGQLAPPGRRDRPGRGERPAVPSHLREQTAAAAPPGSALSTGARGGRSPLWPGTWVRLQDCVEWPPARRSLRHTKSARLSRRERSPVRSACPRAVRPPVPRAFVSPTQCPTRTPFVEPRENE